MTETDAIQRAEDLEARIRQAEMWVQRKRLEELLIFASSQPEDAPIQKAVARATVSHLAACDAINYDPEHQS